MKCAGGEMQEKNIPFANLVVDENKTPHLGHISLATYDCGGPKSF